MWLLNNNRSICIQQKFLHFKPITSFIYLYNKIFYHRYMYSVGTEHYTVTINGGKPSWCSFYISHELSLHCLPLFRNKVDFFSSCKYHYSFTYIILFIDRYIYLSLYLYIYLPIYLSIYLPIYLSIHVTIHLSTHNRCTLSASIMHSVSQLHNISVSSQSRKCRQK